MYLYIIISLIYEKTLYAPYCVTVGLNSYVSKYTTVVSTVAPQLIPA